MQIYTAALDGCIHLWNYENRRIESTWRVESPIGSMVLPTRHTAVLSTVWAAGKTGRLSVVSLSDTQGKERLEFLPEVLACKLNTASKLEVSPNGDFVATADGQRVVLLCVHHRRALLTMLHTRTLTVCFRSDCAGICRFCRVSAKGEGAAAVTRRRCIPRTEARP